MRFTVKCAYGEFALATPLFEYSGWDVLRGRAVRKVVCWVAARTSKNRRLQWTNGQSTAHPRYACRYPEGQLVNGGVPRHYPVGRHKRLARYPIREFMTANYRSWRSCRRMIANLQARVDGEHQATVLRPPHFLHQRWVTFAQQKPEWVAATAAALDPSAAAVAVRAETLARWAFRMIEDSVQNQSGYWRTAIISRPLRHGVIASSTL
jgi:hypothetical protein